MKRLDLSQKAKTLRMGKKGQSGGLVTGLILGIASLIIGVIIALVIVQTLNNASLLGTGTTEATTVSDLSANFSEGIDNVSEQVPTILLVAAIVLLIGVLAVLVGIWQRMRFGGSSI